MKAYHTLEPIFDKDSKVLILGSIPSIKSRKEGFYYAHPRNRFWKTLELIYGETIGSSKDNKIAFLQKHHIALFDVLKSCDISSSSDSSIKNPVPNDLSLILLNSNIKTIFTTGQKAHQLYQKYCYSNTLIEDIPLPSTSPANCSKGIENKLLKSYSMIKDITDK